MLRAETAEAVRTVTPTLAPQTRYLSETGTVSAAQSIAMMARVSGTLEQIDYRDGQHVDKGALLFVIEPAPYRIAVEEAQAGVAQAEAQLSDAQSTLDRDEKLIANSVTAAQVDTARAQRDEARALLASAHAQYDQAQLNLSYTEVRAPFAGYVSAHQADIGAVVGQGSATTLATLVAFDPIEVDFAISDTDMLRLREKGRARGMTFEDLSQIVVEAGFQQEAGYPFKGHLDYIAPQANQSTGTLSVRAVFDNPDRALVPGLFVRLRIPLATDPAAMFLPPAAIGADQGNSYVLIVGAGDQVLRREVTVGPQGSAGVEVSGALQPGDRVIANVLSGVRPGDTVTPVK